MEEKLVPVYYDDELIPNQLIKVIHFSSSSDWFADYNSLLKLQNNLPQLIENYNGVHHTNAYSDKVLIYSK